MIALCLVSKMRKIIYWDILSVLYCFKFLYTKTSLEFHLKHYKNNHP